MASPAVNAVIFIAIADVMFDAIDIVTLDVVIFKVVAAAIAAVYAIKSVIGPAHAARKMFH